MRNKFLSLCVVIITTMKSELFSKPHPCLYAIIILGILSVFETTNGASLISYELTNLTRVQRQAKSCNGFKCTAIEQCINGHQRCDGTVDCTDGSDEFNDCKDVVVCSDSLFTCDYGACINVDKKCNGRKDCRDNSDEANCIVSGHSNSISSNCKSDQFQCKSGQCIALNDKCNGITDCDDKSDETKMTCFNMYCPSLTFKCDYGACVHENAKCNGVKDCVDNSDEEDCAPATGTSSPTSQHPTGREPCELPEHPDFGQWSVLGGATGYPRKKVHADTVLIFGCNKGYKLSAKTPYVACQAGGWSVSQMPKCLRVNEIQLGTSTPAPTPKPIVRPPTDRESCELPEHPDFGQWALLGGVTGNPKKKVPADTVLIFNCNEGYRLSSQSAYVICQTSGWSVRKMPTCVRVNEIEPGIPAPRPTPKPSIGSDQCELPDHPNFGQWSIVGGTEGYPRKKVRADTAILFGCNEGYKLSSESAYVVCRTDGWSSEMPTCLKKCPPLYTTEVTNIKCLNSRNIEIKCDEATHGTSAAFMCAPYYESLYSNLKSKKVYCWSGSWTLPPPVCQPVCGEKKVTAVPLIVDGQKVEKGDYPWVAAIYMVTRNYQNVCGGSILTQRVILTAAHCVSDQKGNVFEEEAIVVGVGKYYNKYKDPRDTQAQYSKLSQIIVPRAYKGEDQRFASDIALLITKDVLLLSKVVQPVCFQDLPNLYLEPGFPGVITGWGYTHSFGNVSDELREIPVPYKPENVCKQEFPDDWVRKFYSYDKMCAGRYNESKAVCNGDSGGGLVFKNPKDHRYYVHGIASLTQTQKGGCNIEVSTLYTKVALHYDWLEKLISQYLGI